MTNSKNNFFSVIRPGTNTTYQDLGRKNLNHIGLPVGGAMDIRNYKLANSLLSDDNETLIEFAYQGPLLKFHGKEAKFAITGNVNFNIIRSQGIEIGECYKSYHLKDGDQIDIISVLNSVYGYLAVEGGFKTDLSFGSSSTNTNASLGGNNGKKISDTDQITLNNKNSNNLTKKLNYINSKIEYIRVIKATNYNYFTDISKNDFFTKEFIVSKFSDRMGMRLSGPILKNNVSTNIRSEGIIKGVIQIPPDGSPIIMLSDHGTIGGYPKIASVISADFDKVSQLPPGSQIKFKEMKLKDAENLYNLYNLETQNLINQIN